MEALVAQIVRLHGAGVDGFLGIYHLLVNDTKESCRVLPYSAQVDLDFIAFDEWLDSTQS